MFFNNNLERPDVFLDEGIMFKVSPNSGLNLTHLRTTRPSTAKIFILVHVSHPWLHGTWKFHIYKKNPLVSKIASL